MLATRPLLPPKTVALIVLCVLMAQGYAKLCRASDEAIFASSKDFTVTEKDLRLYLQATTGPDGAIAWGSPDRVQQAISDLFVLKVLARRGVAEGMLSDEEQNWIAYYNVALANVRRLVANEVEETMKGIDWQGEAKEYYLAQREEFVTPESLTVRTILLKTEDRTIADAVILAEQLMADVDSEQEFARVVIDRTEDSGNPDGKIVITKGQTVPEFEAAAFALEAIGEISGPVVSQFGVHVIQLLARDSGSVIPFEEVQEAIIARLKQRRAEDAAGFIRTSPHREPPDDVIYHDDVINEFLGSVAAQYQASMPEVTAPR